ncbi:MAG: TrkH family potassium uptake protein [Candidatus Heritagella sp.]
MNFRLILRYIGYIVLMEGAFMIPAMLISLFCDERASWVAFLAAIILSVVVGFFLSRLRADDTMHAREGFATVALGWIVLSFFGALPFFFSGAIPSFIDCWFETVSGFTTTGASILPEVESLSYGLLYWRCFTHWLGGMGVLVFVMAVIPLAKGSGNTYQLMRAESPGPSVGKLTPTIRSMSRRLYEIYVAMTLLEILLLLAGGMPLFEAVTHSFATAGTGGFSVKNLSIGAYDSAYLQLVIAVFMALFGVNFGVYYLLLTRQFRAAWKNEEVRVYGLIMLGATLLIGINILPQYENGGRAFLDSFFQVSSIMTTTGFSTANFDLWPELSRFLLVVLMLVGACAGSTGGGIKVSRLIILFKHLKNEMGAMLRPHSVRSVRVDGKKTDNGVVRATTAFLVAYLFICILSMALVALDNFSQETTVTAVLACLNNIGPGLDLVGPMGNFSSFSGFSKFILSLDMLFGRLEIFPMLFLFTPAAWKKAKRPRKNRTMGTLE